MTAVLNPPPSTRGFYGFLATTREHRWAIFLFLICGFLVFNFLDNQALWQDEGETAMLSKSVLLHGYPTAYCENYLVSPVYLAYKNFGSKGLWLYATWIPYYLTAASFALFGTTTWAARFPHALAGFLAFVLTYIVALKIFREKSVALFSIGIMAVSVPTLLLFRQCRYYSLQTLFVLLVFLTYFNLVSRYTMKRAVFLALSLLGFFHVTQGIFIPVSAWLVFDFFVIKRARLWSGAEKKIFIKTMLITAVLIIPWYFFLVTYQNAAELDWIRLKRNLEFSVRMINKFIFPFAVNAGLLALIWLRRGREKDFPPARSWVKLILPFLVINSVFFIFLRHRMMRYYVHLFPFYFMIQAWIFSRLTKRIAPWFAAIMFVLICLTNVAGSSGTKLFSPSEFQQSFGAYFPDFLHEITHRYEGPISSAATYLRNHAKPGDKVKIPMNADSDALQFHVSDQLVLNSNFFAHTDEFPDWIVPRDYWVRQELAQASPEKLDEYEAYLDEIGRRYERITLSTYDIIWENRPDDMGYHKFRTVTDGLYRTMIYRKLSEEEVKARLVNGHFEQVRGRGFDRQPLIPTVST